MKINLLKTDPIELFLGLFFQKINLFLIVLSIDFSSIYGRFIPGLFLFHEQEVNFQERIILDLWKIDCKRECDVTLFVESQSWKPKILLKCTVAYTAALALEGISVLQKIYNSTLSQI